jgi:hypothetical protein
MLAEYALSPCIFDINSYNGDDNLSRNKLCDSSLKNIRDILIEEEALVRNLRNGDWSKYVLNLSSKHPNTKYILRLLNLRSVKSIRTTEPSSHFEWCQEALESHRREPLNGIIASPGVAANFMGEKIISSIEDLSILGWLRSRSNSVRLSRTMSDYLDNLRLILSNANSIKFIDPYLDPTGTNYREFYQLISAIQRASGAAPRIEVHRKYSGSPSDPPLTKDDWINRFRRLSATLTAATLKIEVFVWDDFHDRYLITNLIGINLNNGFDISSVNDITTWNKLNRQVREDINKEFTPDSMGKKSLVGERRLIYRFTIPE